MGTIRIATRSSELALRQARQVQRALEALRRGSELVTYETVGDKRLDRPLNEIGAKGLFTAELEDDLRHGRVDCCVHSLKDLPTASPEGLEVVAVLPREDPRDALIVRPGVAAASLAELPEGARVGTSSLRRRSQLLALRPDVRVVELRGNVPTRLRKIDDGQADAAILAAAGLHRLERGERVRAYLDAPEWLPAAGQGAIAIQIRADDAAMREVCAAMNDARTMTSVRAERAFLAALEGGCQVPIGALAVARHGALALHGFVGDVRGERHVRGERAVDPGDPEAAGRSLAEDVRARGADAILVALRSAAPVPAPQPE